MSPKDSGSDLCLLKRMGESNFRWLGANVPVGWDSEVVGAGEIVSDALNKHPRNPRVFPKDVDRASYNARFWKTANGLVCMFGTSSKKDLLAGARGSIKDPVGVAGEVG